MRKPISVLVLSALVLTSCGTVRESRLNPFNWFGASTSARNAVQSADPNYNPLIPPQRQSIFRASKADEVYAGIDVDEVTGLFVERRPGGALIRATGLSRYQGAYAVKLVKLDTESDASTLTFALRAEQYRGTQGTAASRQVTAAEWLTDNDLAGVQTIRVKARNNTRTARR